MPSSVKALLDAAGLNPAGVCSWNEKPTLHQAGVYVVARHPNPGVGDVEPIPAPISRAKVDELLVLQGPDLTIDGVQATADTLEERAAGCWLPDETVLYIGRATKSVATRVQQYYMTPLGADKPHAGGWMLKLLNGLDDLYVHYAAASEPVAAESAALDAFCAGVSKTTCGELHDPDHPLPFANLAWPGHGNKQHGIKGATGPISDSLAQSASDAASWVLTNASDQLPHLDARDLPSALYVGRRLDQSWRALEHRAGAWMGDSFQDLCQDNSHNAWLAKLLGELITSAPPLEFVDPPGTAAAHLRYVCEQLNATSFGDVCTAAVRLHVARRSFSVYRVAKYLWAEPNLDAGPLYQLLEA